MKLKTMMGPAAAAVLWCGAAAFAQGTGTIHGTVTDPSGLAVPGAQVTATLAERGTTRVVATNTQGAYVLPLLPIGTYAISVGAGTNMGRITSAGEARVIQFALKVIF